MLNVLKDTKLEKIYEEEKFHILTKEEYVDIVCDQLELLKEDIVINRLTADGKLEDLIEPKWIIKKFCVLNDIDKEMKRRNSYQGISYKQ
jgi:radical SAM superfamily enzyme